MDFSFEIKPDITKEFLLSYHSEETYMEYYLGVKVSKKLVCNTLRNDHKPTASFYRNSRGELIFKDFGTNMHLNFISVVMTKYGCNYYEAMEIIAKDFGLISGNKVTNKPITISETKFAKSGPTKIQIEEQDFSKKELEWWAQYGIDSKLLHKYNVFSCKSVFLNGKLVAQSTQNCPIFGYYMGKEKNNELWRLYFPSRKSYRFISNTSAKKIQGFHQLPKSGKLLIITKSMKDNMALRAYGIPAISPNSETLFVSDEQLAKLKERFNKIVVIFDQDRAGKYNMALIRRKHPELTYFVIPKQYNAKDFSDLRKLYGYEKTKKFIIEVLKFFDAKWSEKI